MVDIIKAFDQYPCRFKFGNFFNSIILSPPPFCWGKISSENAVREECVISFCLGIIIKPGGDFYLGAWVKMNGFNCLTHKCIL